MKTFKIAHLLVLLSLTYILLGCSKIEMPKPSIVTLDIMDITVSSAKSGGVISSDNGSKVTDRGICWSLKPNPTLKDSVIKDEGNGTGTFKIDLTNLNSSTTYFVCAFATNAGGTAYGNEVSFTTLAGVPKACFTYSNYNGYTVNFTNCSDFPTTCLWDFGDGETSTALNPTHTYQSTGSFDVKLTVSNDDLTDYVVKKISVSDEVFVNKLVPLYTTGLGLDIDVDLDGINDFHFSSFYYERYITPTSTIHSSINSLSNATYFVDTTTLTTTNYFVGRIVQNITTSTVTVPKKYDLGDIIYSSTNAAQKSMYICLYSYISNVSTENRYWINAGNQYIGYKKTINGITKIGWIKLVVSDFANITIISYKMPTEGQTLIIDR